VIVLGSLLSLILAAPACAPAFQNSERGGGSSRSAAPARFALAPPMLSADGQLRFGTTPMNEMRAEDATTGQTLWTLPVRIPAAAPTARWRLLLSDDGSSIYVQSVSDEVGLTYQGTQRLDPRTGVELANDIKFESYWYQNVLLWTALRADGNLQMAVRRPLAAGGGYQLRTLDPQTLRMLTDVPHARPPAIPPL
jgi:outer membrane protein assembly factor BamB